jgi:hypothetical protein
MQALTRCRQVVEGCCILSVVVLVVGCRTADVTRMVPQYDAALQMMHAHKGLGTGRGQVAGQEGRK